MKLHIPEQSDSQDSTFPTHPRKLKKWLADLPHANMGEMTQQIFKAIREINRQKIPAKHRLEIMEILRTPSRSIFDNLKKHFINRSFPLPEKSKKIVTLNQVLLQEMALGYKIIIQQAADKSEKIDAKNQTIAIARAIVYQSELLLRTSEIYVPVPVKLWRDTHQIFAYAFDAKLHRKVIDDNENPNKKTTIEDLYKQILLFSLSRPAAMRQSDSDRVYKKLYHWIAQTRLGTEIEESQINRLFCARIEDDQPPSYLDPQDCNNDNRVFTLDTTELVENICKEINNTTDQQDAITVGEKLSIETLEALSTSLGVMPKRRFSRTGKHRQIVAAIGLSNAAKMISKGNLPESLKAISNSFDSGESFTLKNIPEELKAMSKGSPTYLTQTETNNSNVWDLVARGRVMINTTGQQERKQPLEQLECNIKDEALHWHVVNISAGGYRLHWNSETTSKAQIGELIAINEHDANGAYEWRIGVIRWMQSTSKKGLEIGVRVLSPKVIAAQAHRFNKRDEAPFDALMIPGIKPLNQPSTIILPAHAFKTGDKLNVEVFERKTEITLSEKNEHTGSFTQFQYVHKVQKTQRNKAENEETTKKKSDFDEIWSSL